MSEEYEDDEIEQMYLRIATKFLPIAAARKEPISKTSIIKIAGKFVLMARALPADIVDEHLEYEADKYMREGLRSDYL